MHGSLHHRFQSALRFYGALHKQLVLQAVRGTSPDLAMQQMRALEELEEGDDPHAYMNYVYHTFVE